MSAEDAADTLRPCRERANALGSDPLWDEAASSLSTLLIRVAAIEAQLAEADATIAYFFDGGPLHGEYAHRQHERDAIARHRLRGDAK